MQKYILSLIILVYSSQIFSQKLSFSVVVDPQVTWMKSNSQRIKKEGYNFGYNFGLVMDEYFDDNYAISTGLTILNTGGNLHYLDSMEFNFGSGTDTLPGGTTLKYNLRYITIPFSLKFNSTEIGYTTMFAHIGLNNHINIRSTADVPSQNISGEDIKNEINRFLMSYFIGGGVAFSFGGDFAILGGIYLIGAIWDVTKNKDYRAFINAVALRLGVKF
ncbi:MAG: hypothetical protein AMS26_03215 [Bacteroides sp. SM23_62]|nr:MAG: hypothetical protein AMS26_03215 [Bacteroides sp. SM23_62]